MAIDVTRHEPDDDPPWIEAEYEGTSYRFQILGDDQIQLTATGQDDRVHEDLPPVVADRLESMGYADVRT